MTYCVLALPKWKRHLTKGSVLLPSTQNPNNMAQWIEVKVRYDKMTESGKTVKVTDPYLVDAVSCTEAEARVVEEISSFVNDFNVLNVGKTKISEIFWDDSADKWYLVKVAFVTIDEKTAVEKKTSTLILTAGNDLKGAYDNFMAGMEGTMADFEIQSIAETPLMDVYKAKLGTIPAAKEE